MIELNQDGHHSWQKNRDRSKVLRDEIMRHLKAAGGIMPIKDLVKAVKRNQLAVAMCCDKWTMYFEVERRGWRDSITNIAIHRHMREAMREAV